MAKFGGEYRHPKWDATLQQARAYLLDRLGVVAPEIVAKLREDVLPRYNEAWEATAPEPETRPPKTPFGAPVETRSPPHWTLWLFREGSWNLATPDVPEPVRAVHDALLAWAGRYRMEHDWILDGALRTLSPWHEREALQAEYGEREALQAEAGIEEPAGLVPSPFLHAEAASPFRFEYTGWPPTVQTRAAYEAMLDAAYENAKRRYFARTEAKVKARRHVATMRDPSAPAWDSAPELNTKERPDGTRGFPGFDWFIRYEFLGETQAKLAEAEGVHRNTVKNGIHEVGRLVGLTPRDGRGSGRAGGRRASRRRAEHRRRED